MMRSRRPRTFEELYNKPNKTKNKETTSMFDYEKIEQRRTSSINHSKNKNQLVKREERQTPRKSYTDSKSSSYIIQKAREVPSAIYGTRKTNEQPLTPSKRASIMPSGYRSSIIEEIKRERLRKQKRQAAQKENERARQNQALIQKDKYEASKLSSQSKQSLHTSTETKARNEQKRVGPKFSYPALHLLGETQNDNYEFEDEKVTDKIITAFESVNVPIEIVNYQSNGMFGSYEMRVKGNLRIGQLNQLKTVLRPYMDDMHFRITTDKLSSGIINIEVPLIKKNIITFNTLFNASSLRLRKNDFRVALGKTLEDRAFSFPLTKAGHILIYGGRSDSAGIVIDNIIFSLFMNQTPYELKLHFISETGRYKNYEDLPYKYEDFKDITDEKAFDVILNELSERQNQFRRAQVRNITSFNQRVGPQFRKSTILVVIDDLHTILKEKNSYAYNSVLQLLTKGKSLGIHAIVRQSETSYDLRFELIRLLQTRVSFFDPMQRIISGSDELSEHRADCLVQLPTTTKPTRVTLGSITERVQKDILSHIKNPNLS